MGVWLTYSPRTYGRAVSNPAVGVTRPAPLSPSAIPDPGADPTSGLPNTYGPTSICPLPYDNAPRGDVIGPHKTGLAERHEP